MKELRHRINSLHQLQRENESKLIKSIEDTIQAASPGAIFKSIINSFFKDKEAVESYPKIALNVLLSNVIDRIFGKKSPLTEPIKDLVAVRFIDSIFNGESKRNVKLKEQNHF
jgi:hypothetical protein